MGHEQAVHIGDAQSHVYPGLAELSRQLERFIDHQLRAIEELDDKSEQMIALGLVVLGAGLALIGLSPVGGQGTGILGSPASSAALVAALGLSAGALLALEPVA